MSEIYKINVVKNNEVKEIFIFGGPTIEEKNEDYFSPKEKEYIKRKNISTTKIKSYIYEDDTIMKIKQKILMECYKKNIKNKSIKKFSVEEMYLFSKTEKKLNMLNSYNEITENNISDLTNVKLNEFLFNIVSKEDYNLEASEKQKQFNGTKLTLKKEIYDMDYFENLNIWNKNHTLTQSIGQKLTKKNNYPFISNPFNNVFDNNNSTYDPLLDNEAVNLITTQNAYLLFKYFPIQNNNIYLCFSEDVINYFKEEKVNKNYLLKLYYPILFKNIAKFSNEIAIQKFRDEEIKIIKKSYEKHNNMINLFHNIHNDKTKRLNYDSKGISYIDLTIRPENISKLPLEILFKTIHSDIDIPLIKFNPGYNFENIYRVFTDNNISVTGVKVPHLYVSNNNSKMKIKNISRILSKNISLGFFIEKTLTDNKFEIFCEIMENGEVNIKFNSNKLLTVKNVDEIIKKTVEDLILKKIRDKIKHTGYNYIKFNTIENNKLVKINDLKYVFILNNTNAINVQRYVGCLSSVFNIISGNIKSANDEIELVYKRVNVFHLQNSISSFITRQSKNNLDVSEIIDKLTENFPKEIPNIMKARSVYGEWYDEIQMKLDSYGSKKIIESNPGFETIIKINEDDKTVITVNNIDDINYLKNIEIYIDSILKILFKEYNSKFNSQVKTICNKTKINEEEQKRIDNIRDNDIKTKPDEGKIQWDEPSKDEEFDISEDSESEEDDISEESEDEDDEDEDEDDEASEKKDVDYKSDDDLSEIVAAPQKILEPEKTALVDEKDDDDDEEEDLIPLSDEEGEDDDEDEGDKKEEEEEGDEDIEIEELSEESDEEDDDEDEDGNKNENSLENFEGDLADDSSDDDSDEDDMKGGEGGGESKGNDDGTITFDLKDVRVNGPNNYFETKRRNIEPVLFSKSAPAGYTAYSKNCQSVNRRQPMLITDKEKEVIDEIDKSVGMKSYDGVLKFGLKDRNKYNYICPRFWCIKDPNKTKDKDMSNKPLSLKQVDDGECGGWNAVMKDDVKKVPKNKYIFEFSDTLMHRNRTEIPHYNEKGGDAKKIAYNQMYPNFAKSKKIAPGLCAPCCFLTPPKNIGVEGKFTYFDPTKHKELEKRKDEWMKRSDDGNLKIDFEKLEKMDYKNELKITSKNAGSGKRINSICRNQDSSADNNDDDEDNNKDKIPNYDFPLRKNEFGYMNIYLQEFLNFDNKSICYSEADDKNPSDRKLKLETHCLLRLGVENNIKQSFLYMLSTVYEFYDKGADYEWPKKTISDFKTYFIDNLTIDKFVSAQNGILPKLFVKNIDDIDENKYNDSVYLKSIGNNTIAKKRIISAFENFKKYINDENEEIDYKYIWDLVCKPKTDGGVLFKDGINLLIFKETNDDMTFNKIEIICPMNYYSNNFFDENKKTLMVVTNGDFYEPLCTVQFIKKVSDGKTVKWYNIDRFLNPMTQIYPWGYGEWKKVNLKETIKAIKENLLTYCKAKPSIKKSIYNYTQNIDFKELKKKLEELYKPKELVIYQIISTNNKVIAGLYNFNEREEKYIYIPSHPSPIDTTKRMKYINNIQQYYLDYKTTKEKLEELYNNKIPCKPISKISENGIIVGIKTETNQFVPVKPNLDLGIPPDELKHEKVTIKNDKIENSNEYILDEYIINNDSKDNEMLKIVKGIRLENNFYTMFRNTLKIMLSDKKYKDSKKEIINLINDPTKSYIDKFEVLKIKLNELLSTAIEFHEIALDIIEDFDELISCFGMDDCPGDRDEKNVGCFLRKNICSLMLPKFNLFNSEDNEILYYNKLTDELLRYPKIKNYIFTQREYLTFDNINYKINDNEVVLLEGILLNTYLNNNLILVKNNKYANESIYELIPPPNAIENVNVNWNAQRNNKDEEEGEGESKIEKWIPNKCENEIDNQKTKSKLNIIFNNDTEMKLYQYNLGKCKFVLIEKIIKNHLPDENISIDIIKNRLIEEHKKNVVPIHNKSLVKGYDTIKNGKVCKLISLLYAVNKEKRDKFNEIEKEGNTDNDKNEIMKSHIMNDNYDISDFEIFLILKSYNIPALILSPHKSGTILNKDKKIFNTDTDSNEYYVIVNNKIKYNKYLYLYTYNNKMKINKNLMLTVELNKSVTNIEEYIKDSVKIMENKRIKALNKDKNQKSNRRTGIKIGKKKLPSK